MVVQLIGGDPVAYHVAFSVIDGSPCKGGVPLILGEADHGEIRNGGGTLVFSVTEYPQTGEGCKSVACHVEEGHLHIAGANVYLVVCVGGELIQTAVIHQGDPAFTVLGSFDQKFVVFLGGVLGLQIIGCDIQLDGLDGTILSEIHLRPLARLAGIRGPQGADVLIGHSLGGVVIAAIGYLSIGQIVTVHWVLGHGRFYGGHRDGTILRQQHIRGGQIPMVSGTVREGDGIVTQRCVYVQQAVLIKAGREHIDTAFKVMGDMHRCAGDVPPVAVQIFKEAPVARAAYKSGILVGDGVILGILVGACGGIGHVYAVGVGFMQTKAGIDQIPFIAAAKDLGSFGPAFFPDVVIPVALPAVVLRVELKAFVYLTDRLQGMSVQFHHLDALGLAGAATVGCPNAVVDLVVKEKRIVADVAIVGHELPSVRISGGFIAEQMQVVFALMEVHGSIHDHDSGGILTDVEQLAIVAGDEFPADHIARHPVAFGDGGEQVILSFKGDHNGVCTFQANGKEPIVFLIYAIGVIQIKRIAERSFFHREPPW